MVISEPANHLFKSVSLLQTGVTDALLRADIRYGPQRGGCRGATSQLKLEVGYISEGKRASMSEITRRELLRTGLALSAGSLVVNRSEAHALSTLAGDSADPAAPATIADP